MRVELRKLISILIFKKNTCVTSYMYLYISIQGVSEVFEKL
jgi:hypothetical protein